MAGPSALVVSAHAADFVWRAGGAIALHAAKGYEVTIVCLSFGERGESAKLWKQPGVTLQGSRTPAARRPRPPPPYCAPTTSSSSTSATIRWWRDRRPRNSWSR